MNGDDGRRRPQNQQQNNKTTKQRTNRIRRFVPAPTLRGAHYRSVLAHAASDWGAKIGVGASWDTHVFGLGPTTGRLDRTSSKQDPRAMWTDCKHSVHPPREPGPSFTTAHASHGQRTPRSINPAQVLSYQRHQQPAGCRRTLPYHNPETTHANAAGRCTHCQTSWAPGGGKQRPKCTQRVFRISRKEPRGTVVREERLRKKRATGTWNNWASNTTAKNKTATAGGDSTILFHGHTWPRGNKKRQRRRWKHCR